MTYPKPGGDASDLITHRIVSLGPGFVRTQADERSMRDPLRISTRAQPTMPRVVFAVPFLGRPLLAHIGWWAWAALVAVATAALVAVGGRDLGRTVAPSRPRTVMSEFVR